MQRHHFAFIVATIATLGSLYFSEVMLYLPCKLCWFQRIFMYPLAIYYMTVMFTNRCVNGLFVGLMAGTGWAIALYHVILERIPNGDAFCSNDCLIRWVNYFGFVTIPLMSLIAFTLILLIQFVPFRKR
ncbi:disulfide bond formation protein B [Exiguobacterium alkaliphilum]|uniref:disulfide bond formation protein B n=1 Tax=Exiguobacterium alkaliphilum TaxID=1428684 RepID=UPI001BAA27AF|nr:disulfide bond formation protein B [Exiguobacterium alkaliphilum]QUE85784.1 disulfide bond formation protein B [Exiguobacterium alkaliphilum]